MNSDMMPVYQDHTGRRFSTLKSMAEAWGKTANVVLQRLNHGRSVEYALTQPVRPYYKPCHDHKGNRFTSITKMCEFWHINQTTYRNRLKMGLGLERALTTVKGRVIRAEKYVSDPEGRKFPSMLQLAMFHKISHNVLWYRLNVKKWPLSKALSYPVGKRGKRYAKNAG